MVVETDCYKVVTLASVQPITHHHVITSLAVIVAAWVIKMFKLFVI